MNQTARQSGDGVRTGARRRRPGGFTLIECVLSLVIVSALLLACTSVITFTLRSEAASRTTDSASVQTAQACRAASRIAEDLREALAFSENTPTSVTFTVPDRTGDGVPETIRYAWAGVGAQVIRWQNDLPESGVSIAEKVDLLDLSIPTVTVGPAPTSGTVEGSEVALCTSNQTGTAELAITSTSWAGGYFRPTLPTNTVSWRVTRAQFEARKGAGSGPLLVMMYRADANCQPTGTPLETVSIPVASLPTSRGWVDVAFSTVNGLDPAQALVFVMGTRTAGSAAGYAMYKSFLVGGVPGMSWTTSSNGGSTWSGPLVGGILVNKAMQLSVYGRVTIQP